MPDLFNFPIADTIDQYLSPGLLPAVLIKIVPGTPDPNSRTAGTQSEKSTYPCRGVVTDYSAYEMAQGLVKLGDRKILLIAKSIAGGQIPEPNDQVMIEGATYRIGDTTDAVKRDPAAATYECRARR